MFHYPLQNLLLHKNARRIEKCRINLRQNDEGSPRPPTAENIIVYVDDIVVMSKDERPHSRFKGNLCQYKRDRAKTQPRKVSLA